MRLVSVRQESFAAGMNDTAAPEEYLDAEVRIAYDGRLDLASNGFQRRDGSKRPHATALNMGATCWGATRYRAGDGTEYLVAAFGDTIYYSTDDGASWTQIATGLREDYWSFVVTDACGTPTLYGANGATNIYSWDGTTWGTLTGEPAEVRLLSVFAGRLYAGAFDEETIKASKVKDFDDWTIAGGALTVQMSTNDGDTEIMGLYQLGEAILVWKRHSFGYIAGYGFSTLQVEAGPEGGVSRSVGCIAPRSIQATAEDAVVWLSKRGLEFYRLGGQSRLIGRPLQGTFDGLNHDHILNNPYDPCSVYWPRKNEYWLAVPIGDGTTNTRIIVWRPPGGDTTPAFYQFRIPFAIRDMTVASRTGDGEQVYATGTDGFVRQMELGERDDVASDGTGGFDVELKLRSRPFTYGGHHVFKKGRIARAIVEAPKGAGVDIGLVADGEVLPARTVEFPAAQGPITKKARLNGRGYVLNLELTTTNRVTVQGLELESAPLRKGW